MPRCEAASFRLGPLRQGWYLQFAVQERLETLGLGDPRLSGYLGVSPSWGP